MPAARPFDIVVLGATGYTGQLTVQYIYEHLPTDLKWAVAGRSVSKLVKICNDLQEKHPDRRHPAIETLELRTEDLNALAQKTQVLINCVGPYHLYSTPVVEACINNTTHYIDTTGEPPWMYEILGKYNQQATANGTILVQAVGLESAPTDLCAYLIASYFRKHYNLSTDHVTTSIHRLKSGGFSGGTILTALSVIFDYPVSVTAKVFGNPYALSSTPPAPSSVPASRRPLHSRLLGPFTHPQLGVLTTQPAGPPNVAIAHRSASLLPQLYGHDFRVEEYLRVPNLFFGSLFHLSFAAAITTLFLIPPIRWLFQKYVTQPGMGPSDALNENSVIEFRGLGEAHDPTETATKDGDARKKKMALSRFEYKDHAYYMTAALMAEAAMSLLVDPDGISNGMSRVAQPVESNNELQQQQKQQGQEAALTTTTTIAAAATISTSTSTNGSTGPGGFITPAVLAEVSGGKWIERLKNAGFVLQVDEVVV